MAGKLNQIIQPALLYAFREVIQKSLSFSPAELVLGYNPRSFDHIKEKRFSETAAHFLSMFLQFHVYTESVNWPSKNLERARDEDLVLIIKPENGVLAP